MRVLRGILLGGLISGVLDITYAINAYGPLSYGVPAEQVLQSVAAGAIGRDAAQAGGTSTAALGLALHFMLTTAMAAVFVLAVQRFRVLASNPLAWGFLYGLVLYVAMNYIVVPLSAAGANQHFAASFGEVSARLSEAFSEIRPRHDPNHPWLFVGTIFAHTILVGMPIAWVGGRFVSQRD